VPVPDAGFPYLNKSVSGVAQLGLG